MVLGRVWGACGVKGARSRLQGRAITGSRSLSLNCAWCHVCCGVITDRRLCGVSIGGGESLLEKERQMIMEKVEGLYFFAVLNLGADCSQILRLTLKFRNSIVRHRLQLLIGEQNAADRGPAI